MREACGDAHMKTILATGECGTLANVYKASLVCMMAGKSMQFTICSLSRFLLWIKAFDMVMCSLVNSREHLLSSLCRY